MTVKELMELLQEAIDINTDVLEYFLNIETFSELLPATNIKIDHNIEKVYIEGYLK